MDIKLTLNWCALLTTFITLKQVHNVNKSKQHKNKIVHTKTENTQNAEPKQTHKISRNLNLHSSLRTALVCVSLCSVRAGASVSGRRLRAGLICGQQRSADARKLVVRRTRTILGTRDFAVSSAVVWNSLPAELQVSSLTVATYDRHLKQNSLVSCPN